MAKVKKEEQVSSFATPVVGTTLSALSGLSFLFLCMLLPLVGPSGSAAPHAGKNFSGFLGALLVTLALSVVAAISKLERRKVDGSPLPVMTIVLTAICGLLLLALLTGMLSI